MLNRPNQLNKNKTINQTKIGGEDASFVLPMDLGVFDGVGGAWRALRPESMPIYRSFAFGMAVRIQPPPP